MDNFTYPESIRSTSNNVFLEINKELSMPVTWPSEILEGVNFYHKNYQTIAHILK